MRPLNVVKVLFAVAVFVASPLQAQKSMVTPSAASGWQRVEQLPVHTAVDVRKDKGKILCLIDSVTDDQLTCSMAETSNTGVMQISRAEIKSIKLPNKGRSAVNGLLIGAGIGAGAGAGIGLAINAGDKGSYTHVSSGKSAGVGAALGVVIGGVAGALIGHSTDLFGSTVYKR